MPPPAPPSTAKRSPRWHRLLGCFLLVGQVFLAGCPGILYTQKQLLGADPHLDLFAAPVLHRLPKLHGTQLSVRGVRLMDPISRAKQLWGQPSFQERDLCVWTDAKGNPLKQIVFGRQIKKSSTKRVVQWRYVVRRIDLFLPIRDKLHPRNRPLLLHKNIRSTAWRTKVFGAPGKPQQDPFRQWYIYTSRGFRYILFSKLAPPPQRRVSIVLSLFIPTELMTRRGIFSSS